MPQGIAEIRTADGKTVLAAGDSLLLKAKGIEKAKMFREELYDGLDNPAQDFNYTLERLIPFSDMVSVQRAGIEPDSVSLHEIESISFDRSARRISRSVTARSH